MKPAISNLAWPAPDDEAALRLVSTLGFTGVEIAPMRVFGPLEEIAVQKVGAYRRWLAEFGLGVPSLQGLVFGVKDVHLFTDDAHRKRMHEALVRIADIAAEIGAGACVFGAPAARDPGALSPDAASEIATSFFRGLGPEFAARDTSLCIEANPDLYGCRFITQTREAFDFVDAIGVPGIRLQLDTGTMFINHEAPKTIEDVIGSVAHCHVSEPCLNPVGSTSYDHAPLAAALKRTPYHDWVSIEMRETDDWPTNIRRAAELLATVYGMDLPGVDAR